MKRFLLLLLLAFYVTPSAFAAIDAVLVGARGTSGGASVATTGGTVATGDTLVACISYDPGTTITGISDTAGNTYSLIVNNTSGAARLAAYQVTNATGHASNVLTVNFSGAAFPTAHLIRVTDALTAGAYDSGSMVSSVDAAIPYTITSNTLAQADSVVISCSEINRDGGTNNYTTSDSTLLSQENDATSFWTSAVSKVLVTATTARTVTWTKASSSGDNGMIIFAIREDTGAPPASSPVPKVLQQAAVNDSNYGAALAASRSR